MLQPKGLVPLSTRRESTTSVVDLHWLPAIAAWPSVQHNLPQCGMRLLPTAKQKRWTFVYSKLLYREPPQKRREWKHSSLFPSLAWFEPFLSSFHPPNVCPVSKAPHPQLPVAITGHCTNAASSTGAKAAAAFSNSRRTKASLLPGWTKA